MYNRKEMTSSSSFSNWMAKQVQENDEEAGISSASESFSLLGR
jgi:hypothetical protein